MVKMVITERHLLLITLSIAIVSLGLGIYNTYSINKVLKTTNPFYSLSKIDLPVILKYNPVYGNSSDIIIFEYIDYLCPFCAKFDIETLPKLEESYIKNGRVTYVVKNFIIHGYEAMNLAIFATCVYLSYGLEKFLDFKHSLYGALYDAAFVKGNYTVFEESLNDILSKYNVTDCLNNQNLINEIVNSFRIDYNEAIKYKHTGTPGFVILIRKDILSDEKLRNVINTLDIYRGYGLEYSIWLSTDEKYVIISFSGALPIDFFNTIFSSI